MCAVLGISACTSAPFVSAPPAAQPVPPPQEYGLEPGDVVRISVWREEALDQGVLVRPDGGISFPLVGEIEAEGKTVAQISDEITQRLAKYIPDPVVTVSLQQSEGNKIYVTGRVNNPGVFLVNGPVDIMQALSMAGGLNPFADKNGIKVLRRQGDAQTVIPFDYRQVRKGEALQQNIILQAGDTIVVP